MKIAVIGGTGLIGSRVVKRLNAAGHEAVPHSQSTGVDVITGEGLAEAVAGADVVVNLTNSPTFDDASPGFFQTSMDHLLAAAQKGGVGHVVILSIVGADRVPGLAYYRAKVLQEDILKAGPIPYSIVHATQFMEFMDAVLSWTTEGDTVRLPTTPLQLIAAQDVSDAVADVAVGAPLNGTLDIAGPDVLPLDELGRITLNTRPDGRTVVTDDTAGMFAVVQGDALIAKGDARIAPTHYSDWLS
ncbi:SDR family oxidoreductase [Streptomyces sp. NPDC048516]|uniref:SDR family oxidoreductase n=1 Tax=Streptomyces sp. NPDC048516 TaxID=3365565 RepID=UPI00371217D3